jgi:hypothetical protein
VGPAGVLTVVMTAVVLFTLTGYQVTSETAATRLLGRLGAALIEIDRWLPEHREDIVLLARDRPDASVRPNDLPIDVVLSSAEVLSAEDDAALRRLMLRVMGETLYGQGPGAFRGPEGEPRSLGIDEPLRWSVMLLESSAHGFWRAVLPIGLLLWLAPVAGVLLAGRLPFRQIALGAGVAAAASLAWWALMEATSGLFSGAVDRETILILRDGAWLGLRNSIAVGVAAVGIVALIGIMGRPRLEARPWQPALPAESVDTDSPSA